MHELTLCRTIIEIVKQEANRRTIQRIHKIYLEIGQLMAVEKSALVFCFNVVAKNTIAENARLEIVEIVAKAHCHDCNQITELSQRFSSCQYCRGFNYTLLTGEELKIKAMEV